MDRKAEKHFRKGERFLESNQPGPAIEALLKALDSAPDHPRILAALGKAYLEDDQYLRGLQAYDRIVELDMADAEVWLAIGNALSDLGEFAQARGAFDRSLALNDGHAESHHNCARAYYQVGDVGRAATHLERALQLSDSMQSWQGLATLIPTVPNADHAKTLLTRKQFARKLAEYTGTPWPKPEDRPPPRRHDGPLRLGYVCAFYHNANYTKPVWGLINHHDRSKFHVSLFSDSPPDSGMPCYQPHAHDQTHDIRGLDNEELTQLIRASEIDILIDLDAYSYEQRLGLYLRYPAPVNFAWWAMYATSGLPGIDYLVGDDEMLRDGEEEHYSETILRLPLSYLTFTVDYPVPDVVPPPCLENGFFTFGSLIVQYKITPHVLDAWAEMLKRVPTSKLLLANRAMKSKQNRLWMLDEFRERGVEPERLDLRGPAEHQEYLRYYDDIDLALDSYPYNGGTTTMEAMWQGVPVLTCDGDRWISRTSQTLLRRSHLAPFVGDSVPDMIDRGVHWASDPQAHQELASLRANMREQLTVSSACDTEGLARGMEQLYSQAWAKALGN